MSYLVKLTMTGDEAEADSLDAILLAARTLCADAAEGYGVTRLHREGVMIMSDEAGGELRYDGLVTQLARSGA